MNHHLKIMLPPNSNAVFLIKNFNIRPTRRNGSRDCGSKSILVNWDHVNVEAQPDAKPCTSSFYAPLLEYIREQKRSFDDETEENGLFMLFLEATIREDHDARIFSNFLRAPIEELCRMLPSPYFHFVCRISAGENNAGAVTFEKRLELKQINIDEEITGRWPVADRERAPLFISTDAPDRKCAIDILLGWVEEEPAKKLAKICTGSLLRTMYGMEESSKELAIVAANGKELKCHRLVFEAHNDVLATMVSPKNGLMESQTSRIKMIENSEEGLSYLIKYLYGLEVSPNDKELSSDVAVELLKTAEKYELSNLRDGLAAIFLQKEKDWFHPNDQVELYFHIRNLDGLKILEQYSMEIMLRSCERFMELKETDSEAAYELIWRLLDANQSDMKREAGADESY